MGAPIRETIFALSSGVGVAGVAVVRVSGPHVRFVCETIIGRTPEPRVATLAHLRDPAGGTAIDQGLVVFFSGPASFTGEDLVEFQVHGSRAVIARLLGVLGAIAGCRAAEAGEFTARAFEAGKLDLLQVEALGALLRAETEWQRRMTARILSGALGRRVQGWREVILELKASLAAEIDFADESDVPSTVAAHVSETLRALSASIDSVLRRGRQGALLDRGCRVVIGGAPNAGKSSLLNALAARDVALVSPYPGTTRDLIECRFDLGGYPVTIVDTAGQRETADPIERMGVARAREALGEADIVVWLVAGAGSGEVTSDAFEGFASVPVETPVILVSSKIDLSVKAGIPGGCVRAMPPDRGLPAHHIKASVSTGEGIAELLACLQERAASLMGGDDLAEIWDARQHDVLTEALSACVAAREAQALGIEYVAADIDAIDRALGRLVGQVGVEEVLGAIFSRFCIGK
jgi:tRNA modification GTPase